MYVSVLKEVASTIGSGYQMASEGFGYFSLLKTLVLCAKHHMPLFSSLASL